MKRVRKSLIRLGLADGTLTRGMAAVSCLPRVDYVETGGPRTDDARTAFPRQRFILHNSVWGWSLANPDRGRLQEVLAQSLRTVEMLNAPLVSIHLGFSAEEVQIVDGVMQAVSVTLTRDVLLASICRNVRALASTLSVPLILENLDYSSGGAYEHVCTPDFISQVLEETTVGMLLDVAHAQVSASNLGLPIEDYLAALPLNRVRQIHVSGSRPLNGALFDAHQPLTEEQYALLERVLRMTEPEALTLEYQGDQEALEQQLVRLRIVLGQKATKQAVG